LKKGNRGWPVGAGAENHLRGEGTWGSDRVGKEGSEWSDRGRRGAGQKQEYWELELRGAGRLALSSRGPKKGGDVSARRLGVRARTNDDGRRVGLERRSNGPSENI